MSLLSRLTGRNRGVYKKAQANESRDASRRLGWVGCQLSVPAFIPGRGMCTHEAPFDVQRYSLPYPEHIISL